MKHTIVTLCAGACLIIAGTATAATDPDFNRLDTNKDGLISWPEYAAKNPQSGRLDCAAFLTMWILTATATSTRLNSLR